ncbi:hypothetical protein H0H93_001815, partial [Arthromyces matolae]
GTAGNEHIEIGHFPSLADIPGTITVAALDCYYHPAHFSNYGKVDIWAVGENIKALVNDQYWRRVTEKKQHDPSKLNLKREDYLPSGTSLAAPQVAGIIAIIISVFGNMPPADMKKMVIEKGIHGKIQNLDKFPFTSQLHLNIIPTHTDGFP